MEQEKKTVGAGGVCETEGPRGVRGRMEKGKVYKLPNGNARVQIADDRNVVISKFNNNVYMHFWGKTKDDHYYLRGGEVVTLAAAFSELKKYIDKFEKENESIRALWDVENM